MASTKKHIKRDKDTERFVIEKVFYCQYCGAETGNGKKPGKQCPNCGSTTGRPSRTARRIMGESGY